MRHRFDSILPQLQELRDSLSSLQEPLMAPTEPSFLTPIISSTPALAVKLTRPPKLGQRKIQQAQPLPWRVQLFMGPRKSVKPQKHPHEKRLHWQSSPVSWFFLPFQHQ